MIGTAHVGAGATPALVEHSSTILRETWRLIEDRRIETPAEGLLMTAKKTVELRSTGRVGHTPLRGHCRIW